VKIKTLPIQLMDPDTEQRLHDRGKIFVELGKSANYMSYTGTIYRKSLWSLTLFKADGRIMIDGSSFRRMNPNYKHQDFVGSHVSTNQNALESVSEKKFL